MIDAPTLRRYLNAIDRMTHDQALENRAYARQCWRDLSEPGVRVHDYLEHVVTLPLAELRGPERRLRLLAEHSPLVGYMPTPAPRLLVRDGVIVTH